MDAQWRQIWKRKNPWYDAWKDAEFQIFRLRAQYEPRFPNAPCLIADGHRAVGQGVQQVQEEGDNGVSPPPEQRASISPAPGLAPAHWVRRLIRTPPIIPDPFPVAHADTNFIQTFVANIFIF